MATTKRAFYIVDLVRKRKEFANLDIPATRVDIVIEVEATVPTAKMDRLEKAAREKLEEYERIIPADCDKFNKRVGDLMRQRKAKEAEQAANDSNTAIRGAMNAAEGAAMKAVEQAKLQEAQGDQLLLEARVKTAIKFTFGVVKIVTNAVRIGGSHGADAHAWGSLVKELITLGIDINQLLTDEPKLRSDLFVGAEAYITLRTNALMEVARKKGYKGGKTPGFPKAVIFAAQALVGKGKEADAKNLAKELTIFVQVKIKAKYHDVETARDMYRNETFRLREKIDEVSAKSDKLFAMMKAAPDLKEGVKIGAACMLIKGKIPKLTQDLTKAQTYLKDVDTILHNYGLDFDDTTILAKFKALDIATILTEGKVLADNLLALQDLVDAVAAVA